MSEPISDHSDIHDTRVTRRYFAKFRAITGHMSRVAAVMEVEGSLSKADVAVLARYLAGLTYTFSALSQKYLFSGRVVRAGKLSIDQRASGFPLSTELVEMAVDASQLRQHLAGTKSADALKDDMVRAIVGDLEIPTKLQFALSRRLYYEELAKGALFWARNAPQAVWLRNAGERRTFLVHWAVYDTQLNVPTVYLMEVEDTGRVALPKDDRRWPEVQAHLMAQAVGGLKLLTIARGFDQDFDDLHPKRLRRIHLGPMYSSAFTRQNGPMQTVLEEAQSPAGEDWALVWTVETLEAERAEMEKKGWFGSVERQVFALDPFAGQGADTGATKTERAIILPQRPYQVLEEKNPPGFADVRKFVVSPQGRVLSYR